jgi:hypothetical protein
MGPGRDRFIERQTRINNEFVRLAPGEPELQGVFSCLALETYDLVAPQGISIYRFTYNPNSAGFFLRPGNGSDQLPAGIIDRWRQWEKNYPEVVARNPRLELRHLMQTMSEASGGSSWPDGFEWQIERWVADGEEDRNPYLADRAVYARLRDLHARLGGWLYLDDDLNIIFAELSGFRAEEFRRNEERAERIRKENERFAKLNADAKRWRDDHIKNGGTVRVIRTISGISDDPAARQGSPEDRIRP